MSECVLFVSFSILVLSVLFLIPGLPRNKLTDSQIIKPQIIL